MSSTSLDFQLNFGLSFQLWGKKFQLQQKKPTMPKTMRNPLCDGSCRSFIEESTAKILNFPFLFFKIGITSTHFHFKLPKFVTKNIFTCILGI